MKVIWFICLHCLILESPAPRVTWLVDFFAKKANLSRDAQLAETGRG